jgi:CHAT domain-containing protein/tetratricopeptide (TPR) repeat protein
MRLLFLATLIVLSHLLVAQTVLFKKIDSLTTVGSYQLAILEVEKNLELKNSETSTALLRAKKAELYLYQGNFALASDALRNITSTDPFIQALVLSTSGKINLTKGRFDLAQDDLERSLSLYKSVNQENSPEAIQCLASLASYYVATGKYNQAEEFETAALQLKLKVKGETSEEVAASYNNLGLIYLASDPDKAIEYYEKALSTYQKIHDANHPKMAIANTNLGIAYNQLKLFGDAINYFETAKKIWEKIYPNGHPNQSIVLRNLGRAYALQKNQKVAIDYYTQAIAIYQKAYGNKHPDLAGTYNELGSIYLSQTNYDDAIANFQRALIANSPSFSSEDVKSNPTGIEFYNPSVLVYSLNLKAQALEEKYIGKTLKLEDLKMALGCLYLSDSLIDEIRHQSADENDKLSLGSRAAEVYEDGVRIAMIVSENVLRPQPYLEKAFYFAEKSKSAVLQESIADAQAKSFTGIPPTLLEEEKVIKSTIALVTQKLAQKPTEQEIQQLRRELFDANASYRAFTSRLEKEYPNYFNLKFSKPTLKVSEIQRSISDTTAVLSYFIAEKNNKLYLFQITQKGLKVKTVSLPSSLDRTIKGFTNGILYTEFNTYQKSANVLSPLLLPSLPSSIRELIVIPTGKLGTLPFEALSTSRIKGGDFRQIAYAIQRYSISYEFSSSLLLQKKEIAFSASPSIFLCAPIKFNSQTGLSELPGTQKEVTTIANLFQGRNKSVLFADANELTIKSPDLASYQYLHFATHGIVDEINPESSKIFLSASAKEDGNLYAGEIYNLNLNAQLTVLSACQTGLGKVSKGEGVIGLSRALVYAGSQNIIVSFWSVADESTSLLMTDFYTALLKQKNSNFKRALQQSKLKMIQSGNYAAPFYWAPFVLIGK